MDTKVCARCKQEKPLSEFRKNRARSDGYDVYCKPCRQDYMKQDREKNLARYREYYNKWRRENTESARQNYKDWYKANKTKRDDYTRKRRQKNREKINQVTLTWRHRNIERVRETKRNAYHRAPYHQVELNHRRRAQRRNNGGSYTQAEWESLCAEYDFCCACCGEKTELTVDHVIPLCKGGSNDIDNIQPLCKPCNSRKWTKTTDYRKRVTDDKSHRNRLQWIQIPLPFGS